MVTITTAPATAERWDDVVAAMTGGGDGGTCWCRWPMETSARFGTSSTTEKRAELEAEVSAGPPRGLLAYVDGAAAGWVRIAPRPEQGRIARGRMARASNAPRQDASVWALTCVQVRREHRGLGVVGELVSAAIDFARANGATLLEAYPVDTSVTEVSDDDLFHGPASAFLSRGFAEVARPRPARPVLQLALV
ncbi:MAG: GNAT family N-acetyltransferase [Microbacteriaceae bacterium]|nr:GNAT family N-acetyltransferase [Microbacteriaceae bacterium]